ncbi:hypothetical protein like AT4G30230 [Hibiscus trionum]|uniref:Uncharacterized protein n=1 Tax=Hibiscus trionum TaxID=183268 RepID=A0A9W7HB11_HIBTR|nr:hypothetical protein like AT4G30230 [Hibiscus trionum]
MHQIKDSWEDFVDESNEETLSLSDLVLNNDHSNDFSKQQEETGDFFQFFTEDFPASPSIFPENDGIIFCGKIISYKEKQPNVGSKPQRRKYKIEREKDDEKKDFSCRNARKCCLFPWKISSPPSLFNKSRTFRLSKLTKESKRQSFNKSFSMPAYVPKNNYEKFSDEKFDFPAKKVSTLASPVKSRWYFFAFGVGRFPMEIELKDMKMRQSRKYRTMKFQALDGGSGGGRRGNVKGEKGRRSAKARGGCLMF